MRGGDGSFIDPSPHGDNTRDSPATDSGVRYRRRGGGDIHGVIPVGTEVGGVPGRWVTGKGKQSREAQGALNVPKLEIESGGLYRRDQNHYHDVISVGCTCQRRG